MFFALLMQLVSTTLVDVQTPKKQMALRERICMTAYSASDY